MSHEYKKVIAKDIDLSFVRAVTERGDYWSTGMPRRWQGFRDDSTHEDREFMLMSLMEQGILPRVSE